MYILSILCEVVPTAPEVVAAYITAAVAIGLAIFAFIERNRERSKNQVNQRELEAFKQSLEHHNAYKKEQITFVGKMLNHVYLVRVAVVDCMDDPQYISVVPNVVSVTINFLEFYRANADMINDLDGEIRTFGHTIMEHQRTLRTLHEHWLAENTDPQRRERLPDAILKKLERYKKSIHDYEIFLRIILTATKDSLINPASVN